jgi:hypothetical protein
VREGKNIGPFERLIWGVFAPFEFGVTVLVGVALYVAGALYFAASIFLVAVVGLLRRAGALAMQRFRVGRIVFSTNGKMEASPSLSEIVAHRVSMQRRSRSWLN